MSVAQNDIWGNIATPQESTTPVSNSAHEYPNGHLLSQTGSNLPANSAAITQNASINSSASPGKSSDSIAPVPNFAKEILKRVSASTTVNAESPEWAAAREQVLQSMNSNMNSNMSIGTQPAPVPQPRGRGRGRPRGSGLQNRQRAAAAVAAVAAVSGQAVDNTAVTPIRRGRGGRPRGSRARGRGRGGKRKREDDTDGASSDSEDSKSDDSNSLGTTPTVTKSGRNITKPPSFNPAPAASPTSGTKRKRQYYRREVDVIICVKCARGHSPPSNQMILCDGCDSAYHQWCHDPMIEKEIAENIYSSWFCGNCLHAREVDSVPLEERISGAHLSMEEKSAYLSSLPSPTLLYLLMHATSLHSDLPIFPPNASSAAKSKPASSSSALSRKIRLSLPTPPASQSASVNGGIPPSLSPATSQTETNGKKSASTSHSSTNSNTLSKPTLLPNGKQSTNASDAQRRQKHYPEYSNEDGDPPATYPLPGCGPLKLSPLTDKEDLPWMMEDNDKVFSHRINDGSGNLVPIGGSRKKSWLARDSAPTITDGTRAPGATATATAAGAASGSQPATRADPAAQPEKLPFYSAPRQAAAQNGAPARRSPSPGKTDDELDDARADLHMQLYLLSQGPLAQMWPGAREAGDARAPQPRRPQ